MIVEFAIEFTGWWWILPWLLLPPLLLNRTNKPKEFTTIRGFQSANVCLSACARAFHIRIRHLACFCILFLLGLIVGNGYAIPRLIYGFSVCAIWKWSVYLMILCRLCILYKFTLAPNATHQIVNNESKKKRKFRWFNRTQKKIHHTGCKTLVATERICLIVRSS